jgi:hypothetical protein
MATALTLHFHAFNATGPTTPSGAATQTWIVTAYLGADWRIFDHSNGNIYPLAHELAEWIDDPFANNLNLPWGYSDPYYAGWCFDDLQEVADPFEDRDAVALRGTSYVMPDVAFVDWFARTPISKTFGRSYTFFNTVQTPRPACNGDTPTQYTYFDGPVPSLGTVATGINNRGDIVGYYFDLNGALHGFVSRAGGEQTFDLAGAAFTLPAAINDSGVIVGTYLDAGGINHGFKIAGGKSISIDVPGAAGTFVGNVNGQGDIVGGFVDSGTGFTHGFIYRNGTFITVDAPFGVQTALSGINDRGHFTGASLDSSGSVVAGFMNTGSAYTLIAFPGATNGTVPNAIDNFDRVVGIFGVNIFDYQDGFIRNPDGTYIRLMKVVANGTNDLGMIVGQKTRTGRAFLAHVR